MSALLVTGAVYAGDAGLIEPLVAADSRSGFAFRFQTPAPTYRPASDGSSRIEIEGFGTHLMGPGAPDIPTYTALIAIPEGARPTLQVRAIGARFDALRTPSPVAEPMLDLDSAAQEELLRADDDPTGRLKVLTRGVRWRTARDPRYYAASSEGLFPEELAWLGQEGVLRNQRYVALHLAPVRWSAALGRLEIATALEVRVDFGLEAGPSTPLDEPRFEELYRSSFANWEQGRGFRLRHAEDARRAIARTRTEKALGPPVGLQLHVATRGITWLTHERVAGTLLDGVPVSSWRLTNRGVVVPIVLRGDDGDGVLEPGERAEFFGQALDDEPKTVVNTDFGGDFEDLYEARDFTDVNVYVLQSMAPGGPAIATRDAAPTLTRTPPLDFHALSRLELDDAYRPLAGADPWYWLPTLVATGTPKQRVDPVPLPGLRAGTLPLEVRVNVRGISEYPTEPDHGTLITLRNASQQLLATDASTFDGRAVHLQELNFVPSALAPATDPLQVELSAVLGAAPRNDILLDYIEVGYRRAFTARSDVLEFTWPDEDAEFIVGNFSGPAIRVFELVDPEGSGVLRPVALTGGTVSGAGPFAVRFRVDADALLPDGTERRFYAVGPAAGGTLGSGDTAPHGSSDLRDNENQADLIVLAHESLLEGDAGAALAQLLAYRATPAGGGLTSKIVRLQDAYDEFYEGISGPLAIREFVRWVLSDAPGEGWADPKPSYLLILGDGSFDYKGGPSQGNLVPTQILFKDNPFLGYYASDNLLAAVSGDDQLADLVVGRIPARTVADAATMLTKTLSYETAAPPGTWMRHALLISDRGSSSGEGNLDFELTNARAQSLICSSGQSVAANACPGNTPNTARHLRYYTDFYTNPSVPSPKAEAMRTAIVNAVNGDDAAADGAAVLQFNGHGNFVVWSNDAFFDQRPAAFPTDQCEPGAPDLLCVHNGLKLPWLMAHNCLTGGFHVTQPETMGEDWLRDGDGGAVGVFSPTGLSFNYIGEAVNDIVWKAMYGPRKEREIGPIVLEVLTALCGQGSIEPCQHYVVLGDPALRLALRSVEPPEDVQAQAGNARVDLTWSAPSAGLTFDVFRTASLVPNQIAWLKLNPSPIAVTAWADTGVTNAKTYWYYVVSRDAQGFQSRWSHLQSDCDVDGPDCLHATPLNPNPPGVPAGVAVADPGVGTQLRLRWTPNPENDLATYTVHYGTDPGVYPFEVQTGRTAEAVIGGLIETQPYYFAVSATNTSAKTSALSAEVSDFAVLAPGVRPPDFIGDLRVRLSGDDVVLEWDEVQTDIYGKPAPIVGYEIFRGAFSDPMLHLVATCAAPCSSWTDPGAASGPDAGYRVRAVDSTGGRGALGAEVPHGTFLELARSPIVSGNLVLSWAPVTTTMDGAPAPGIHYRVYAGSEPFTIDAVRQGTAPLLLETTSTQIEITPSPEDGYYSVFAVDARGNLSPF